MRRAHNGITVVPNRQQVAPLPTPVAYYMNPGSDPENFRSVGGDAAYSNIINPGDGFKRWLGWDFGHPIYVEDFTIFNMYASDWYQSGEQVGLAWRVWGGLDGDSSLYLDSANGNGAGDNGSPHTVRAYIRYLSLYTACALSNSNGVYSLAAQIEYFSVRGSL